MGSVDRLPKPLAELIERHRANTFVETGAGFEDGGGALRALRSDRIQKAFVIELRPGAAIDAAYHLAAEHAERDLYAGGSWEFLLGTSEEHLPQLLNRVARPCVWWLDAHFPAMYGATGDWSADVEMPLARELELILAHPGAARDVILVDDWNLYHQRRAHARPGVRRASEQAQGILDALLRTHSVSVYPDADEGYLIAEPVA